MTYNLIDQIRSMESLPYPDYEDQFGKVSSSVGLKFIAPRYFDGHVARVLCVADVQGHRKEERRDLYLDSASSAAFNHMFAGAAGKNYI